MDHRPNIEAVFDYYDLRIVGRDRGQWRKAQCPLLGHEDQNPSASVNTDEGKWFCHACGQGGDGFDILKEREGLAGWPDLKRLAERFADEGSSSVSREPARSSLLPRSQGHRPNRGKWVPPWRGL